MLPPCPGQRLADPVEDQDPVGQPGQAVVQGLMADLVEQAGVADGDGRLAGQAPEPFGDVAVVVEPFGVVVTSTVIHPYMSLLWMIGKESAASEPAATSAG